MPALVVLVIEDALALGLLFGAAILGAGPRRG
jgi:hypothetical protein